MLHYCSIYGPTFVKEMIASRRSPLWVTLKVGISRPRQIVLFRFTKLTIYSIVARSELLGLRLSMSRTGKYGCINV